MAIHTKAALLFVLLSFPVVSWGQDVNKIYKGLEGLSPEKHRETLIEGAKKEGDLTIYFVFARPVLEALFKKFTDKHLFVKVKFLRQGRGRALAARYLTELRAGKATADVIAGGDSAMIPLIRENALASYQSPEHKHFPKQYRGKHFRWTSVFISKWLFGYNTTQVDRSKLPKTYMDLLDPYWKGKVALDPLPNNFVRGSLKAFGKEKSLAFFHKLVETQDIQFRRGRTLQSQLIIAGAISSSPEVRHSLMKRYKDEGAPVDFHFAYPFPVTNGSVGIPLKAPHPYTAALFLDFWLSKEGQQFMVDRNFTVMRKGMTKLPKEGLKNMTPLTLDFRMGTEEWVDKTAKEVFARRAKGR